MLKFSHTADGSGVGSEDKSRASGVRSTDQMCYRWITLVGIQYVMKYTKKVMKINPVNQKSKSLMNNSISY